MIDGWSSAAGQLASRFLITPSLLEFVSRLSLSRVGVLLTYRGVADPACCDVSSTTIDHLYFTLVYVIPQITNLR